MTPRTDESSTAANGTYADVNGLHMYYESYGSGRPIILLHGGLMSGETLQPVIPAYSAEHQVIVPDLQGHGRTADIDRPIDARLMADDIVGLMDHLGIDQADLVGYSLGGGTAFWTASRYPEHARKLVIVATNVTRRAIYPEMLAQQVNVGPAAAEFMTETPMYQLYQRVAPRPEDFPTLLGKIGASMGEDFDHSEAVRALKVPTLVACADADMAPPSHYVEVFKLLDGGLRDGGWMGEGRPAGGHALAVIPGTTHYNVMLSPLMTAAALSFLDGPPA